MFFPRRAVYLCLPCLVLSLYLWLYHPRSLPVNQGSRVVKEGAAAGPTWAWQNDLRSLLIRRMTSRTRETDSVPLAMSPSLRHSFSTPRNLVSVVQRPFFESGGLEVIVRGSWRPCTPSLRQQYCQGSGHFRFR